MIIKHMPAFIIAILISLSAQIALGVGDTKDREVPTLVEALKVGAANAATTEIHLHVSFVSSKQS